MKEGKDRRKENRKKADLQIGRRKESKKKVCARETEDLRMNLKK